jgi:hypothetical protein
MKIEFGKDEVARMVESHVAARWPMADAKWSAKFTAWGDCVTVEAVPVDDKEGAQDDKAEGTV